MFLPFLNIGSCLDYCFALDNNDYRWATENRDRDTNSDRHSKFSNCRYRRTTETAQQPRLLLPSSHCELQPLLSLSH